MEKHLGTGHKVPALTQTTWYRDLTEEGVGPHPGPTKAITANAQGAQNSWRLANLVIANHIQVAVLVETKFSIQKFADFATFCHKNGFQVFAANHPTIARAMTEPIAQEVLSSWFTKV